MNSLRSTSSADIHVTTIVVGIGMPGAGKTTLLKPIAHRIGMCYINRDDIREELFGDALRQSDKDRVWSEANTRATRALAEAKDAIYDATFAEPQKRREFIRFLREMGWERIIGFYVDTPPEVAIERNRNRGRVVPEGELEKFFIAPLREHPPSLEDGFDELYTVKDIEALKHALVKN